MESSPRLLKPAVAALLACCAHAPLGQAAIVDLSVPVRVEEKAAGVDLPDLGSEASMFELLLARIFVTSIEGEPSKLDIRNAKLVLPEDDVLMSGAVEEDDAAAPMLDDDPAVAAAETDPVEPMTTKELFYTSALNRAKIQFSANDLNAAYQTCHDLLRIKPDLTEAYVIRGAIMARRDRHGEAIDDFNRALRLDPALATAYQGRGISYQKVGRQKDAFDDFTKAIQLDPELAEAYHKRGLALAEQGSFPAALQDFNRYIQLKPNDPVGYHNRGAVLKRLGRDREATADLAKSREIQRRLDRRR